MRRLASFSFLVASFIVPVSADAQCAPSTGYSGGAHGWHQDPAGTTPGCVSLNAGLGGPADFGHYMLTQNDDSWDGPVDITGVFPGGLNFYGGPYSTMWVNTNGNITFHAGLSQYTPTAFPQTLTTRAPMIAPYWADLDTRGPLAGPTPAAGHNRVYYDMGNVGVLTLTWFDVGYYSEHYEHRVAFQLILTNATGTCGSGDFDVEFRYNRCEWVAGMASGSDAQGQCTGTGCTPANVGFDATDGTNYVTIPQSLMNSVVDVCTLSNVGEPGIFRFSVRGGSILCAGGGTPCTVPGMQGACSIGVNVCHAAGLQCQPVGGATTETCDNIDNDCNGSVDDGSGLCPATQVCVLGSCIANCLDGGCAAGFTCNPDGRCVEDSCVGVSCPANQRCIHGACMDSCTGVVCPHNQQCAAGRCTDLCAVVTCDTGFVCQNGNCVGGCPCNPCPTGAVCNADGTCSASGCDITVCDPGFYCQDGTCLDGCAGAMCPANQHCTLGGCVLDGQDGGTGNYDAGISFRDTGIPRGDGAAGGDAGPHGPRRSGGCGCRVESSGESGGGYLMLLALGVVVSRRRRPRAVGAICRDRGDA